MRNKTPLIVLILSAALLLGACNLMRQDMYDPGADGNKGSTAKITVDVGNGLVTNESGGTDTFTIALAVAPTSDVTFPLSSGDTGEVSVSPSSVTFTTLDWSTPRVVTVTGVPDGVADGHVPVAVLIGAASSADPNWSGFNPSDVTAYNMDVDSATTPGVTVSSSGSLLLSEIGTSGSFAVVLSSQPAANVSIPLTVSDPTEATVTSPFSGTSGTLVFTNTDWNTPQVVLVSGVDDSIMDGPYTGTVTIGSTISGDPLYNNTFNPPDVPFTTVDDDTAGVTVSAVPTVYVSENGTVGSFTVVLNSAPIGDVVMTVSVSDATEGVLVAPSSGTLVFAPSTWDVPKTVTVRGVDDFVYDGTVTYPVDVAMDAAATMDDGYDFIDPSDVNFATIDDDSAGVTVSAVTSALVSESGTDSSFTVRLNSQPMSGVTINISVPDTTEGTITAPAPSGSFKTLTFTSADWGTAQTVTVAGVNDGLADGNVPFNVVIGSTVSSDSAYNGTFNPPDIVLTNVDDDTAGVTVSVGSTMVTESGTTASFTVVLNSEPSSSVSLAFSIDDGTEGVFLAPVVGTTGSVTFTGTDWSTAKTVILTGVNDGAADGHQNFRVNFGSSSSTDPVYNGTFTPPPIFYTCIDDMGGVLVPGVVVRVLDNPLFVSENGSSASFQVVLTAPPVANVDIPVSVGDVSEGLITSPAWGASGTITFTPFNWNMPFTVTVTGQDDASADGSQDFWIALGDTSCPPDPPYDGLPVQDVQCRCVDDDGSPGVTVIAGGASLYISESGTTASFKVVLNTAPSDVVVIDVAVDDPSEGARVAPAAGTLTFNPANWNNPQTVTVQGVNDLFVDGNTGFNAVLSMNAAGTLDPAYDPIDPADVQFVNIDDDKAGVTVTSGSYYMVSESGTYCAFSVVLNSQPQPAGAAVTIPVWIDIPSEGGLITPASGQLTFTDANWNIPQTVAAGGLDDSVVDGNQTFRVVLGVTASVLDPAYNGTFDPDDVAFLNVDDDTFGITVNVGDGLITKEHPSAPLADTFSMVLNSQPTANVAIGPITSADTGEVAISGPINVTFTPGNWNSPQTVTVKGVDDWVSDDYQVVDVAFGAVASGDANYNGTILGPVRVYNLDDDVGTPMKVIVLPPPLIGWVTTENGGSVGIPLLLNCMPAANVTVGPITGGANEADVSVGSLTFTPANWNVPQVVKVTGKNDNSPTDINYMVDFGITASTDLSWNGIAAGSVGVLNRRYLAAAPSYLKSALLPAAYTPLSGANTITFYRVNTYPVKDDGYCTMPIGFTFHFMGLPYDRLTVFTNGFATFNPDLCLLNTTRSEALFNNDTNYFDDLHNRIVAPWWNDLTLVDAGSDVFYKVEADPDNLPYRKLTVEWVNVKDYTKSATYSFQLVLKEKTCEVEFRYGPKVGSQSKTATAGIKDSLSGNGHFYDILGKTASPPNPFYDQGDFYSGQLVRYTPYP